MTRCSGFSALLAVVNMYILLLTAVCTRSPLQRPMDGPEAATLQGSHQDMGLLSLDDLRPSFPANENALQHFQSVVHLQVGNKSKGIRAMALLRGVHHRQLHCIIQITSVSLGFLCQNWKGTRHEPREGGNSFSRRKVRIPSPAGVTTTGFNLLASASSHALSRCTWLLPPVWLQVFSPPPEDGGDTKPDRAGTLSGIIYAINSNCQFLTWLKHPPQNHLLGPISMLIFLKDAISKQFRSRFLVWRLLKPPCLKARACTPLWPLLCSPSRNSVKTAIQPKKIRNVEVLLTDQRQDSSHSRYNTLNGTHSEPASRFVHLISSF